MKISEILEKLLTSKNIASCAAIFEKYDKNVQGNTVWERGKVAASIIAPFRDFPELSRCGSVTGVAIATGGNPDLAKISARIAAKEAIIEALVKVSCVGGTPLAATDCLNFGNPEKKDQMGEFVEGVEGLKEACEGLGIPIVSGNVSLYNESGGKSIPPSALVSVFARVDDPKEVPKLSFQNPGETIFLVGNRSTRLGGTEFLKVCGKNDTHVENSDIKNIKSWTQKLQSVASKNLISTAHPIGKGGLIVTLAKASFGEGIGAEIEIPESYRDKIPQFLFSENAGAIIAASDPEKIREIFGDMAMEIGNTVDGFSLNIKSNEEALFHEDMRSLKEKWEGVMREVF